MSMPVCPNCGQWQRPENYGDCLNECAGRGFAQRASFPAPPSAHTPGPWVAENHAIGMGAVTKRIYAVGDTYNQSVATVTWWEDSETHGRNAETDANASLIAAAPDMLAALKALLNSTDLNLDEGMDKTTIEARDLALAAIARAEGR